MQDHQFQCAGETIAVFRTLCHIDRDYIVHTYLCNRYVLNRIDIDELEIRGSWNTPENVVMALRERSADGLVPFAVVIRNTGKLPITGINIRYTVTSRGGEVVKNFFYGSPVDLEDSSGIPVIAPGQSLVVSPDHLASEQINLGALVADRPAATSDQKHGGLLKRGR